MKKIFIKLNSIALLCCLAILLLTAHNAAADFQSNSVTSGGGNVVFSRSATDTNGNIYITGYYQNTFSYGGLSAPVLAANLTNFFLLKTDAAGNALWFTNASSTSVLTVTATAVTTDSNDGVYIGLSCVNTASSHQTLMLGTATFTINSESSISIIAKYTQSTGSFRWAKSDPNSASAITGLAVTSDNSLIATGDFQGAASFSDLPLTALPPGAPNTFVIKISATTGVAAWVTNAACAAGGYNRSTGVALDGFGNIYTTGYFGGTMFSGTSYQLTAYTNTLANSSAFITKWTNSPSGSVAPVPQWAIGTTDTSNSFTSANDLAVDVNSNLYVSFSLARTDPNSTNAMGLNIFGTNNATHYAQTNGGTSEGSIVKFDSNGNILWGEGTLGVAGSTNATTRIAVTSNYVYALGTFGPGNVTFGGITLGPTNDSFLLQLTNTTGGSEFAVPVNGSGATPPLLPQDLLASTGPSGDILEMVGALGGSPGSNSFIAQYELGGFLIQDFAPFVAITGYTGTNGVLTIPSTLLGQQVIEIGFAFRGNTTLTSVTIPSSILLISSGAFGSCSSLTNIVVDPANTNYSSAGGALFDTTLTTLLAVPGGLTGSYVISNSVTSIGSGAFYGCSNLTSVTIPNGLTNISGDAFFVCTGLAGITIPNGVKTIGSGAFFGCTDLLSVVIPNSVTSLGVEAFSFCSGLTNVTIGNGVTTLNIDAFGSCFALTNVIFLGNAPGSGSDVFTGVNTNTARVYYLFGKSGWGATYGGLTTVELFSPIFSGLTASPTITYGNSGITLGGRLSAGGPTYPAAGETVSVTIAGNTQNTTINDSTGDFSLVFNTATLGATVSADVITYAYAGNGIVLGVTNSNTTLTVNPLPVNLTGTRVFDGNNDAPASILTITTNYDGANLTLSGSALLASSAVGPEAITDFTGLTLGGSAASNYTLAGASGSVLITQPASLTYATNNGTVTVTGYSGPGGAVIIPAIVNGLPVTGIGVQAFNNNATITSLYISNGTANVNIADAAFDNCSALTNVFIPNSVTNLGSSAFAGCTSLTTVTGGSNVLSMGGSVFNGDGVLSAFSLSTNLASVGSFAFFNCVELTNIVIPATLTQLSDFMFDDCPGLTNVTLPNTLTSIGNSTFAFCSGLKSIVVPAAVTNLGDSSFQNCTALTNLLFLGNAPTLGGANVFAGVNTNTARVYYTAGATGWGATYGGLTVVSPFVASAFSGLTANQTNTYGASGISLGGTVSAAGPVYPAMGETVSVTINGVTQNTTINDAMGDFSLVFNPSMLPVSGSPYAITYTYAGDTSLSGVTNASTSLTVNAAPLTISATAQNKLYGQTVTFGSGSTNFTSSGLANGETIGTVTLSSSGGPANQPVSGSPYVITPGAATGGTFNPANYSLAYNNGSLTVSPAPLTVTGINAAKFYGATNPPFTVTFAGFVNSQTLGTSDVGGSASLTTAAITNSPIGTYDITNGIGTLTSTNYSFASFADGTLTVNPLPVNLTGTRLFDGNNDAPASILTITTNYDGANLTLGGSASLASSAVGTEAITDFTGLTLGGSAATNYTLAGASGSVLITQPVSSADFQAFTTNTSGQGVFFNNVARDASGNIYVTGYYQNAFTYQTLTAPTLDPGLLGFFLLKTDAGGNALWLTTAQSTSVSSVLATAVTTDSNGGVYVGMSCANTTSSGQSLLLGPGGAITVPAGGSDSAVAKFSQASGAFVWDKTDPNANSSLTGLAATSDNTGIIATGDFQGTGSFGGTALTSSPSGARNSFLIRINASTGATVWATSISSTSGGYNRSGGVALDGTNNIYLTGYFGGTLLSGRQAQITANSTSLSNPSAFVTKFSNPTSTAGNAVWAIGSADTPDSATVAFAPAADNNGNIYVPFSTSRFPTNTTDTIGFSITDISGSNIFSQALGGQREAYVVSFDANGDILWGEGTSGDPGTVNNNTKVVISSNYVYVLGSFGPGTVAFDPFTTLGTPGDFFIEQLSLSTGGLGFVARVNGSGATPSLLPQDLIASSGTSGDILDLVGTLAGSPGSNSFIAQYEAGGPFSYTVNGGSNVTLTGYTGPGGAVTFPATILGLPVTGIADLAFSGATFTSVTIPDSVTTLGDGAFQFCFGLTNVTMDANLTNIGTFEFFACPALTNITIPGRVASIGDQAFNGCVGLASITIPNSVTFIGDQVFVGCTALKSVAIGSGVTHIGDIDFQFCSDLTNIAVDAANPNYAGSGGVLFDKSMSTLIAYPAGLLTGNYTVPGSVSTIDDYAFYACANLTNVLIDSGVANIGSYAFGACLNLNKITFQGNPPVTDGTEFRGQDLGGFDPATVYYLSTATGWQATFDGLPTVELFVPTPAFSGLTANQTNTYGASGITLGGKVSAAGPVYPAMGETVSVTINGVTQNTTINDAMGDFSLVFNPSMLPVSGSPYAITYTYAGDTSLSGVTNASTSLTVNAAPLTISATAQSKLYGQTVTFGSGSTNFTSSGLANSETIGTVTLSSTGGPANQPVSGSPYAITPGAATGGTFNAANYSIIYNNGSFTIAPAPLTVTGNNAAKLYGATNPPFTVTFAGFVNSQTLGTSDVGGSASLTTAAITNNPIGTYDITNGIGTLTSTNYSFASFADGTLTVNPLLVNLTGTRPFDGNNDASASILTITTNYDGANLTLSGSALLAGSAAGTENITDFSGLTLGGSAATNYTLTNASGSVLITPVVTSADFQAFTTNTSGQGVFFNTVARDASGNIYVTGYYQNSFTYGSFTAPTLASGQLSFFLLKTDAGGNAQWLTTAQSSTVSSVIATAVTTDSNGGVYIGMSCQNVTSSSQILMIGSTTFTINANSSISIIARFSQGAGALFWARSDPNVVSSITGLAATLDPESIIATGDFQGGASFSGMSIGSTPSAARNTFILKINASSGTTTWVTAAPNAAGGYNRSGGIALDGSGNIYTTGYFGGVMFPGKPYQINANSTAISNPSAYVVKWSNPASTVAIPQWAIGSTDSTDSGSFAFIPAADSNGTIYVPFSTFRFPTNTTDTIGLNVTGVGGSTSFSQALGGEGEAYVVSFDSNGNVLWGEGTFGDPGTANNNTKVAVTSNYVYVLGSYGGTNGKVVFDSTTALSSVNGDYFLMQLVKTNGSLGWVRSMNTLTASPQLAPTDFQVSSADILDIIGGTQTSPDNGFIEQLTSTNQVVVGPPVLVALAKPNLIITWPFSYQGFTLQTKASLSNPTWTDVATPPVQVGSNWSVTVPATGRAFFRVAK